MKIRVEHILIGLAILFFLSYAGTIQFASYGVEEELVKESYPIENIDAYMKGNYGYDRLTERVYGFERSIYNPDMPHEVYCRADCDHFKCAWTKDSYGLWYISGKGTVMWIEDGSNCPQWYYYGYGIPVGTTTTTIPAGAPPKPKPKFNLSVLWDNLMSFFRRLFGW